MDTEPAVSYRAAVPGTPVLTKTGTEIGTLEHVLEVPEEERLDGLVIATEWGLRFVDADQVELITVRHVRSRLDDGQAARLTPPQGTVVYRVSAMDEIGDALDERLGQMFGRPHWTNG
jgi:sporulation protein YlmC with PRC-barrel domain